MTSADLIAILPLILTAGGATAVILGIAVHRSHIATVLLSLAALAGAALSLILSAALAPRYVTPLLVIDRYAVFFMAVVLASSILVVLLAWGYLDRQAVRREEAYALLLCAVTGGLVAVSSNHFLSLFLGLELLSVPLYAMIAYLPHRERPLEAGLKYLVLAAASGAFLLFGMALVYAETGFMDFGRLAGAFPAPARGLLLTPGLALILVGFGFKLGLAPFHLWTPDVYEGAPAPVAAFIATVSKTAMFALLLRFFYAVNARDFAALSLAFTVIAVASMVAGNVLALLQTNVKRILAYSSIAHLGYVLVAFQAGGELAPAAAAYYLAAYSVTVLAAFGVVSALSSGENEADGIDDYRGLFWERPWLAASFTAALLSLAGIPLTAGFMGKWYVLAAGASETLWLLAISLVVTSAVGLFYYLRIVVALYARVDLDDLVPREALPRTPLAARAALIALVVLLLWLGVYPGPMIALLRATVVNVL